MAAAAGARLKTFKYAYELDPQVDVVTETTNNTPMHLVVNLNGRTQPEVVELIQFLADHGAKIDEMNAAGRTPIALADGQPVDLAVDLLTKLITERAESTHDASGTGGGACGHCRGLHRAARARAGRRQDGRRRRLHRGAGHPRVCVV